MLSSAAPVHDRSDLDTPSLPALDYSGLTASVLGGSWDSAVEALVLTLAENRRFLFTYIYLLLSLLLYLLLLLQPPSLLFLPFSGG